MADLEISNLPPVATPLPTDALAIVNDLVTKSITRAQMHSLELGENLVLPNGDDASDPEIQFPNSGIYEDLANELSFSQGGVKVGNLTTPAAGGLFINNTLTGGGLERVLTTGDAASFGEYGGTFDASSGSFPSGATAQDWFNCTVAGTIDSQAFIVGDILLALIDNPSTSIFAGNWTLVPNISVTTLADLTDVDLSGQAQYDLLFNADSSNWNDTAGELIWNPDLNFLQLANNHSINWLDKGLTTQEFLIFEPIPPIVAPGVGDIRNNFEGTNGARTHTDDTGRTWVFVGSDQNNEISTVASKFGSSSYEVGTQGAPDSDAVYTNVNAENADFHIGTRDFYIRFWFRHITSQTGGNALAQMSVLTGNNSVWRLIISNNQFQFAYAGSGATGENTFPFFGVPTRDDLFHEIVLEKVGDSIFMYEDGVQNGATHTVAGMDIGALTLNGDRIVAVGGNVINGTWSLAPDGTAFIDAFEMRIGENLHGGVAPGSPSSTPPVGDLETFVVGDPLFVTRIDGASTNITSATTDIDGTLLVNGIVTFDSLLGVQGDVTFANALSVGAVSTLNILDVDGIANFHANALFDNLGVIRWEDAGASAIDLLSLGVPTGGDEDFASVVLLYDFDEADGATDITDASNSAQTETFVGNAQVDTAQFNNGTASLLLDGTGDWLTIPDSEDWNFAGGDFTIDVAVRFNVINSAQWFVTHYEPNASQRSWTFGFDTTAGLRFIYSTNGVATTLVDRAFTAVVDTWYQFRVSRIGTNIFIFADGVLLGTAFDAGTDIFHNSTHVLTIGALGNSATPTQPLNGWMDDLRITKGVGRSSATFTLPAGAWPETAGIETFLIGDAAFPTTIFGTAIKVDGPLDVIGDLTTPKITVSQIDILGDINTVTPPQQEAITALLNYKDLANDDIIGQLGYTASNTLTLENLMEPAPGGRTFEIKQKNNAGTVSTPFRIEDASLNFILISNNAIQLSANGGNIICTSSTVDLQHNSNRRVLTQADGIQLHGDSTNDPTAGTLQDTRISLRNDSAVIIGDFGWLNTASLDLVNRVHGGSVRLISEDSSGVERTIMDGDPDGESAMFFAGIKRLATASGGTLSLFSDGDTDTEVRIINFRQLSGLNRAAIGFGSSDVLRVGNEIHGGNVRITAEDIAGVERTILSGNPDAGTTLRADTDIRIEVAAGELAFRGLSNSVSQIYYNNILRIETRASGVTGLRSDGNTDSETRSIELMHQDGTIRATIGHAAGNSLQILNQIHGAKLLFSAEDLAGVQRTILDADPDGITTLNADTDLRLTNDAGTAFVLIGTSDLDTALFFNGIEKFRTAQQTDADQISGAEIVGADGTFQPVGLGTLINDPTGFGSGTITPFQQINASQSILHDEAVATTMNTFASTGASQTDIPAGTQWEIKNDGAGALTIGAGTSVTLFWFDGGGATPPTGNRTLARGGICTVRKISDIRYEVFGNGLT